MQALNESFGKGRKLENDGCLVNGNRRGANGALASRTYSPYLSSNNLPTNLIDNNVLKNKLQQSQNFLTRINNVRQQSAFCCQTKYFVLGFLGPSLRFNTSFLKPT